MRKARIAARVLRPIDRTLFDTHIVTYNDLDHYLKNMDREEFEKRLSISGQQLIPKELETLTEQELHRSVKHWMDSVWYEHMRSKGIDLQRCPKCKLASRINGHGCLATATQS